MDSMELAQLLPQEEGLKLDFKREYELNHSDPKVRAAKWNEFIKDILALTNGNVGTANQAGYLVIGAGDALRPDGTRELFDVREHGLNLSQQQIIEKVNACCHPPITDLLYSEVEIDGKRLAVIEIPPSPFVHETTHRLDIFKTKYTEGTVFIRRGEGIYPAKQAEREALAAEKRRLWEDRRELTWAYAPPPLPGLNTLPDPGPLPPGSRLPFHRSALFTGRVEFLKALARALLYDHLSATLVSQGVQGMGGVGKTQLAVEFCHRYGRYFRGVHWINAAQPDAIGAEVARCGAKMAFPYWPDEQPEQIARTLKEWELEGPRLVILDNLEDVETARHWLARLGDGSIRVLLTARRANWPADMGISPLPLSLFAPAESYAFLRHYLSNERATDSDLDTLAERLGHLPLALELAGRYLQLLRRTSITDYLGQLENVLTHRSMQGWKADLGNPTGHDLDLVATFAVSWEQVMDETARRLFVLAGYCAPNELIPYELLQRAADIDEETCDEALDTLASLGLLQMENPDEGPIIHPLLAEYAGLQGDDEGNAFPALADVLVTLTNQALKASLARPFEILRPHVERVVITAEDTGLEKAGVLWNNLGSHWERIFDYAKAVAAFKRALAVYEAIHGPDHHEVAAALNRIGLVLKPLGDLSGAQAAYERALAIDEQVYGPEHPGVASILNNLGLVLYEQGWTYLTSKLARGPVAAPPTSWRTQHLDSAKFQRAQENLDEARVAFERAMAIWQASGEQSQIFTATLINNMGLVFQAQGNLKEAQEAFERALAIDEAAPVPNHLRIATRINNIGLVLFDQGDLKGARDAFQQALNIWNEHLPPMHPHLADAWTNFGLVLSAIGELEGAQMALQQSLVVRMQYLPSPDHPRVADACSYLGQVLRDQRDLAGARAALERALEIREHVYGTDHLETATTVNRIAGILEAQGDLNRARAAYERVLTIYERVYGPDHPEVATVLNDLGSVLNSLGDLRGAQAAYKRALAIDEQNYGPKDPIVATVLDNLGHVLRVQGDLAGAQAVHERSLAIAEAAYGPDHPNVAAVVGNLGLVLREQGNLAGARAAQERALAITEKVYGHDHPNVATVVGNLGMVLRDQGNLAEAQVACERAMAITEAVYGPNHPNIATCANSLGLVLHDQGDLAGACAAHKRALEIDEMIYGLNHPDVATDVNNLGSVLFSQGDLAGARAAYERALKIDEAVYGPNHPNVAIRVSNLGNVLQSVGDLAGARAAHERALAIDKAVYGPNHPNVANRINNLGSVLSSQGHLAEARAAFERALDILDATLLSDYPCSAAVWNNLGKVLKDTGDLAGARAACERALAIGEAAYGPDHPDIATAVAHLGSLLRAQGDLAGAQIAFGRALHIWEATLPSGHQYIEIARENLESAKQEAGDVRQEKQRKRRKKRRRRKPRSKQ